MLAPVTRASLVCGTLVLGLGGGSASALVAGPGSPEALGITPSVTPVAMCGYTCRHSGRCIPGPPQVCYDRGLEYCGSSRGGGEYGFRGGGGYGGAAAPSRSSMMMAQSAGSGAAIDPAFAQEPTG